MSFVILSSDCQQKTTTPEVYFQNGSFMRVRSKRNENYFLTQWMSFKVRRVFGIFISRA